MRQSAHTVQYKDLLELAEGFKTELETRYAGAVGRGTTNLGALTHKVETARTLVRMLKKGLPGKQTDFKALFDEITR